MPKYVGPSDTFRLEEDGKAYHPGDNIPLSKELVAHHERVGHVFEGTPDPEPAVPVETNVVAPVEPAVHSAARTPVQVNS